MGRVVAAYQPRYYPRLHYLARAQQADVFVIYDDVQFSRQTPQHRAPIEYQEMEWLTIPVAHTGVDTLIKDARADMSTHWITQHMETLVGKYGSEARELQPFYHSLIPSIVDPECLRETPVDIKAAIDGEQVSLVDDFCAADDRWRENKYRLDQLRAEKNELSEQIGERVSQTPDDDLSDLTERVSALDSQIETVSAVEKRNRCQRNELLVELSTALDPETDVTWLSAHSLWDLDGIDVTELIGETRLVELTIPLLEELFRRFEVSSEVVRSSQLDVDHPGDPSTYLARLTEALDGDQYLSGQRGFENYVDLEPFDRRGIDVIVQDWEPTWPGGNVCSLDVIFEADDPGRYIR